MWWKKLFGIKKPKEAATIKTNEVSVIAKCIGCGQCAHGCPMKIKISVAPKK